MSTIALGKNRQVNADDVLTNTKLDVLVASKLNDLLYVSGDQFQLYFNWEEEMEKIDGVTC